MNYEISSMFMECDSFVNRLNLSKINNIWNSDSLVISIKNYVFVELKRHFLRAPNVSSSSHNFREYWKMIEKRGHCEDFRLCSGWILYWCFNGMNDLCWINEKGKYLVFHKILSVRISQQKVLFLMYNYVL